MSPRTERSAVAGDAKANAKAAMGAVYGGLSLGEPPATLTAIFAAQAAAAPDAVAVLCDGQALSYGDLEARANQLAWALMERGIGAGCFVAILLRRSADVYVALLAVLKAGAAYVPLDPDYPPERIQFITGDCSVSCIITSRTLAVANQLDTALVFCLDERRQDLAQLPTVREVTGEAPASAVAYVIYTSGSTGRPKGVLISHASAVHLVRAEAEIFGVTAEDRVFQGFSVGFDASVEEIWLAFGAGATLVVGTDDVMHLGPALWSYLASQQVSVWSTVPTLLAMQDGAVPSLRLLILGGEACSQALVERWWRSDLRLVNTYGPTEATVIATYADCLPGQSVTIGAPVPGYRLLVVDSDLQPLPPGESGELLIGGPGLALGYVGRPDLTAEKFRQLAVLPGFAERLYRTGDLVRYNREGQLEFLGRIDDQVKLRGFRIELGEIEAVLVACPEVRAAAVAVHTDPFGVQALVAYVVAHRDFDESRCRDCLRARLPAYMLPRMVLVVDQLPVLPSGKIDRRRLAPPTWVVAASEPAPLPAHVTPMEAKLLMLWHKLLHPQTVGLDDDFFDIGGHSLLATKLISELRQDPELREVAVLDLYRHPTVKGLSQVLAQTLAAGPAATALAPPAPASPGGSLPPVAATATATDSDTAPVSHRARLTGVVAQASGFYLMYALLTMSWISVYFGLRAFYTSPSVVRACGTAALAFVIVLLAQLLIPVLVKWTVIGRFKAGRYPLHGVYYWRFWLVRSMLTYFGPSYLTGTPWLTVYYRLLGAKIGRGVHLHTDEIVVTDLLTIGDEASINADVRLLGFTLEPGYLRLGTVSVGAGAVIGARSVLQPDTAVGAGSQLAELSLLATGTAMPAGAAWLGSPAKPGGVVLPPVPASTLAWLVRSRPRQAVLALLYALLALAAMLVPVVAFSPVFMGISRAERAWGWRGGVAATPPLMAVGVLLMCLLVAALKWLVVGRVKAGSYPVHGGFYLRKWFVDLQMGLSLNLLSPLYATLYLPPWLRLLGARIGKHSEISTAANITPDLLEIGDDCFVADDVCLGAGVIHGGMLTLAGVKLGKASFTGNSAVIAGGQELAADALIGCLTASSPRSATLPGASWLGSPAMLIPKREAKHNFATEQTYQPPRSVQALRWLIEFARITLPGTLLVTVSRLFSAQIDAAMRSGSPGDFALLPLRLMGWGGLAIVLVIAAKWLLVGRYRAGVKPLWSSFVWRSELVNALHEQVGEFFLTAFALGTPLMGIYFRLMGCVIGRGVVMDSANITEFDLIKIGDRAVIGWSCDLQTHLFEDRIMKMDQVVIGAASAVGEATLVLYDAVVEAGAEVGGLSLVMKGETIPAATKWLGIPIRPESERPARPRLAVSPLALPRPQDSSPLRAGALALTH